MKNTHIRILVFSALASGLAIAPGARAQSASEAQAPAAAADTTASAPGTATTVAPAGYGQLGNAFTEIDASLLRQHTAPTTLHDYAFTYNDPIITDPVWGLDGGIGYDYLSGSANGTSDARNRLLLGLTGYLNESWGKPFLTADAGGAWAHEDDISYSSYAYGLSTGVEFQVVQQVAVSPFVAYEATPRLFNDTPTLGTLDSHEFTYGVKGTYRFQEHWSATLAAQLDARGGNDLGWTLGVGYHF